MRAIQEWQLWMHPYPTLIKNKSRRLDPSKFPFGRIFRDGKELVRLSDLFEARKQTPPQLKRCVRAIVDKEMEGEDRTPEAMRAAISKGFAICTSQLQKSGYLKVGSQKPTKAGKQAGRSKAAQKAHMDKVADYERMLGVARGEGSEDTGGSLSEAEGGFRLNVARVPLGKARSYAEGVLRQAGEDIERELPDFDKNYVRLQKMTRQALDVPRIEMPVIEPKDMKRFDKKLKKGHLDIFAPYAEGHLEAPKHLTKQTGSEWIKLGVRDGKKKDDVVVGRWTSVPAKKLIPTQSQIWLEKLVRNIAKFGRPRAGSPVLNTTIIVSREGYILDGHHRYGQVMLANPDLKLKALYIPLPIELLLKIGRTYGNAIGNVQKG